MCVALVCLAVAESPLAGREWTDRTGKFKVEAELDHVADGAIVLRTADGKLLKPITLDRLSKADREYLDSLGPQKPDAAPLNDARPSPPPAPGRAGKKTGAKDPQATKDAAPAPLRWKLASIAGDRYTTKLRVDLGSDTKVLMQHELELAARDVTPEGTGTLLMKTRRVTGSYDSPSVKGSFDSKNRKPAAPGAAQDIGTALYVASWMPSTFRMTARGEVEQPSGADAVKLAVTHKDAVILTNVLNAQAIMRMFVNCLGPLPADPIVASGNDATWEQPWTSPLSTAQAPPGAPGAVMALWTFRGHKKDGDELGYELRESANGPGPASGKGTIRFDRALGRMRAGECEFHQTVAVATDGASAVETPVQVHFEVTMTRAGGPTR